MFGGFRGGSGGQFSPGGNSFFDPNGFPQATPSPTFHPTTAFQNISPPPSTATTPADNGGNIGGEPAAAGSASQSAANRGVSGGSNNLSAASTVTHSIFLPYSAITTITTTAKPVSTASTDGSTTPATQAASDSATRKNVAPVGIIVGVLLGGISFTIAAFLAVLWVRRRRMQKDKKVVAATPYHDVTQTETHAKGRFGLAGHISYLPPYTPPATSSVAGSSSTPWSDSNEKPLLTSSTATTSRTVLQVANRDSLPNTGNSRWSNSTFNTTKFQPPRYATLFRIMSRPNTLHPSQDHLPLPPLLPATPKSPESDTLSYVTPTD